MDNIKEKLLLTGSILGAFLTILNFFNTISPMIDFFIVHWVLGPILFYIVALLFLLFYFKQLVEKKVQKTNISNIKKVKKKYMIYRNLLIIVLTLFTIGSIAYSYYDIHVFGDNPPAIDKVTQ